MLKTRRFLWAAFSCALLLGSCKEDEEVKPGPDPDPVDTTPVVLDANIRGKLTLADRFENPAIPDYIVNANVSVNAELEIKPGVVIAFARDTRIEINDGGGVLLAKGDSARPIRFIGKETTKGFWSGIVFRSSSSANTLEHLHVLHAGSKPLYATTKAGLAVLGAGKAEVNIKNCVFEQNAGYGLYLEYSVVLASFQKNTFKDNTDAGILLGAENVKNLDVDSKFTGNGRNVVEIFGSSLPKSATTEVVWKGFKDKTPYRILENVSSDANWKLLPGVILEVGRAGYITIEDGYFNAVGTEANKIVIRGAENAPAYWKGLLCFSTSDQNIIENAEISGGGNIAIVSGKKANIAIYGGQSRMAIRKSVISQSGGYGIFVNYQGTVNADVETANTFKDNAQAKLLKE